MVALNAATSSPEKIAWALTSSSSIWKLTSRTGLTNFIAGIVVLFFWTFYALNSIEYGCIARTIHTSSILETIDLVDGTAETFSLIKIKILGVIAFDTTISSPKFGSLTLTLLADVIIYSAHCAGSACSQCCVVICGFRANGAGISIEVWLIWRTADTNSLIYVKH